ncbi:MAG: alanine--tRNA ligase [Candidatus Muproteobacteria bacterium RBG_16_64_10]|uniref:Alanine--tRNA ligase n=1 Tax=Candidatus Muproteobacteria bacterium RBG_16_64_10 TaxID=1817757 RepID=A0A1F6T6I6_9PROT|nr:MAG: alanine--tRNA ligase [Candidatus Muproteobacteria bacterium RBG_16_64_10]
MKSTDIRRLFLEYFGRHGHTTVASSPLVPANDPTLLFTNAGMVQFKDVFLGAEKRPYVRAASSQRCVRAGGKHNDLENVGYTGRHHTFFEMLGNFSFGDYFKREAIGFAWEFLTQELKLPKDKLWVTVYKDDDEAADIWLKEIGVDPKRFVRLGEVSNFWQMGDTGPCGPCSEVFYDHGPQIPGGPPGSPDEDGDRYVEIWNLVFMQFNRDAKGKLTKLPKPSVDTGMGLERIAAVQQGVHSNYDIDLFRALIHAAANAIGTDDRKSHSLNVVADHIRSAAFLVTDGVLPSNEGRGYVLRRIIRRAIRHGNRLGAREAFFYKLVAPLVREMGAAYPELARAQAQAEKVLRQEEERFAETLEQGLRILDQDIAALTGDTIAGEVIFKLYDTYGFPVDLTRDVAMERNLKIDMAGFEREMEAQRERARAASSFKSVIAVNLGERRAATDFTGYATTRDEAKVEAIRVGDKDVLAMTAGQEGVLYLDRTPFYAESGGQVGDQGRLTTNGARFAVLDTRKGHAHVGRLESGEIRVGARVQCEVDETRRRATACNHSATHLLHAALKTVLGAHVQQKGSLVEPARLRFDFSHFEPLTPAQTLEIERLVNDEIRANDAVETRVMALDDALKSGACALFGEKYESDVRVVGMGVFSTELCGGTHVRRTGDIGLFKIVSEGGVAAGVRRIEAITADGALAYLRETELRLQAVAELVRGNRDDAARKVEQLLARTRTLEKEIEHLRQKLASGEAVDLTAQARDVKGIKVLAARLDGVDAKGLREALDNLKDKLAPAAIVLAAVADNKVSLIAGVTKELAGRLHAGELVNQVAGRVGGKGGGRPDMAQAGGTDPSGLEAALADVPAWVEQHLK